MESGITTIESTIKTLNDANLSTNPSDIAKEFVANATAGEAVAEVARLIQQLNWSNQNKDKAEERRDSYRKQIDKMRSAVRNAFAERIEASDDEAEFDLEDANSLLEEIGAQKLCFTWSATVTTSTTISGIEASSKEEAERLALGAVSTTVNLDECGDEATIDEEDQQVEDVEPDDNN